VDATAAQLLDVVEDLCRFGCVLLLSSRRDRGEALIEQAAELLAHRAQVLAVLNATTANGHAPIHVNATVAAWMARWTN
jgi:hypothetical protein